MALTLRMVGGLTVPEIACGFLVQESTMGSGSPARRARSRLPASPIGCRPPRICRRASPACSPLFLVFNEGYLATGPDTDPVRPDLTAEAIRLTRLTTRCSPTTVR